jgi:hypothetical protein
LIFKNIVFSGKPNCLLFSSGIYSVLRVLLPKRLIPTPAFSDNFFVKFVPDFVADANAFTSNLLACANFFGLLIPFNPPGYTF